MEHFNVHVPDFGHLDRSYQKPTREISEKRLTAYLSCAIMSGSFKFSEEV